VHPKEQRGNGNFWRPQVADLRALVARQADYLEDQNA